MTRPRIFQDDRPGGIPLPPYQKWRACYVRAANGATKLLQGQFIREQKGCSSIFELDQKHMAVQIINFAQNARFFAKSAATLMIPHRSQ